MKNPWHDLPDTTPLVIECDRPAVEAFNAKHVDAPSLSLQTHLLPEPFFGNVASSVYVLGLNPGYSLSDDNWHRNEHFVDAIRRNLVHSVLEHPHYYLDPRFAESPGARWWRQKCRWLIDDCGVAALSRNLFCAELFPYHSTRYKPLPKSISLNGLVDSSEYTASLVRQAIDDGKLVVAMRSVKLWCRLVPELASYDRLLRLNSPQNVSLSPRNLPHYNDVTTALTADA